LRGDLDICEKGKRVGGRCIANHRGFGKEWAGTAPFVAGPRYRDRSLRQAGNIRANSRMRSGDGMVLEPMARKIVPHRAARGRSAVGFEMQTDRASGLALKHGIFHCQIRPPIDKRLSRPAWGFLLTSLWWAERFLIAHPATGLPQRSLRPVIQRVRGGGKRLVTGTRSGARVRFGSIRAR